MSLRSVLKDRQKRKAISKQSGEPLTKRDRGEKTKVRFPNPLGSLKLIFEKDVAIILFYNSIVYMTFVAMNTSTPSIFNAVYGFNNLVIGLCYLPYASGGIFSSVIIGRLLDYNYRRIARLNNFPIDYKRGNDLRSYPIELARLQIMFPLLVVAISTTIGYGWAMNANVSLAPALILQFILGFTLAGILQVSTTLLVDLYPMSPSTVSASNNLIRCCMGAVSTAILNPLLEGIGRGWTFTLLALLALAFSPGLLLLIRKGPGWREKRRVRIEKKALKGKDGGEAEKSVSPANVQSNDS